MMSLWVAAFLAGISLDPIMIGDDPAGDYYDELYTICEEKTNTSCCRASVHEIRKQRSRVADSGTVCAPGFKRVSLRCPSSFNWCAYKSWKPDPVN